jgi:hypothetical protein
VADAVRLLAPFDPVVWDRQRFEAFWGWAYRFEAYTPASKRKGTTSWDACRNSWGWAVDAAWLDSTSIFY